MDQERTDPLLSPDSPGGPCEIDGTGRAVSTDLAETVYAQLRALAQQRMNAERHGHTLSATALVHEVYLRLAGPRAEPWQNRAHFYAAAAQAMQRILIDHARAKGARGGVCPSLSDLPDAAALLAGDPERIVAVDAAITRLESEDPEAAAVVRLRFYAGLSAEQAAETLGISLRSAARLWTFARATLHRMLREHREV